MRRLIALGTLTLAAVGMLVSPASGGTAFVTATPTSGAPGTPIAIDGNCGVAESLDVDIGFVINDNSITLATTSSDSSGAFHADATAPQIAPPIIVPGQGEIVALCIVSPTVRVTTPFTLLDASLGAPRPSPGDPSAVPPLAAPEPAAPQPVMAAPTFTG